MDPSVETPRIPNPIEQKVHDTFNDYPLATQKGIALVLEEQQKNWQRLRRNPNDIFLQSLVEYGTYLTSIPSVDVSERPLTELEKEGYQNLLNLLEPYKRPNTYGLPSKGLPNTRFYVSLRDSTETPIFMLELTRALMAHYKKGDIAFFQYKFDSNDDNGQLRFDPIYRDKGASPILYIADKDLEITQQLLDKLAKLYPNAFLPQIAPFKYSPHGTEIDSWHISMESSQLFVISKTPEAGMKKAISRFLQKLGLTNEWTPIQSLKVQELRKSWEEACSSVHRQPKEPWLTTERPTPSFFVKNK